MTDQKTYVAVLRARSTARFKPDEGAEVFLGAVPGSTGRVRFRLRTRWVHEGHDAPTPRELWIEGRGPAPSLDEAASKFAAVARFFSTILSFSANTPVGIPEVHVAYDASAGSAAREFLEVFIPDERGHPSEGRIARTDEFTTVFERLDGSAESSRLHRAIQQYGIALRYWYLGGEWLALSHLYIGCRDAYQIRHSAVLPG